MVASTLDMQADSAYIAGMQYTVRDVPPHLDRALRARARDENKSLNQLLLEALQRALGEAGDLPRQRDLTDIAGTWRESPEIDQALQAQRQVDLALWR
jgi:hypothetical protein